MEPLLLKRPEAAKALGISTDTLDILAARGYVRKLKIGACTRYDRDDILRFAQRLAQKGAVTLAE